MQNAVRVLVIEDNPSDARLWREALTRPENTDVDARRFHLYQAASLAEALKRLAETPVDAVVTDLTLPDSSGLETFSALQAQLGERPILILSGVSDEHTAIEAVRRGAADYLVKDPGVIRWLARAVLQAVERYHANAQIRQLNDELKARLAALEQSELRYRQANENLEKLVSERTEALLKKEAQLHQAQKLEAIGRLAGGVAHDFNNLLTGIVGLSDEMYELLPVGHPALDNVSQIMEAADRAFGVTRQLLAFGRRQVVQPRPIDINVTVRDTSRLLARLLGENVRLEMELLASRAIVMDPGQLQQVVMNLAINSRDAMPSGGTIRLSTRDVAGLPPTAVLLQKEEGPHVVLEIADSGEGIDPAHLPHIFEPFFTTKPRDKGTGLGLATVYGIVEQTKGNLEVQSTRGQGTVFRLYFPVTSETPQTRLSPPSAAKAEKTSDVVLLVEDERIVRLVVERQLKNAGYKVIAAESGEDALRRLESEPKIDLIVTDVIMPGMDGRQLIAAVRARWPEIDALYISGYPEDVVAHQGVLEPGIHFLQKPNLRANLIPKIQSILNARKR